MPPVRFSGALLAKVAPQVWAFGRTSEAEQIYILPGAGRDKKERLRQGRSRDLCFAPRLWLEAAETTLRRLL